MVRHGSSHLKHHDGLLEYMVVSSRVGAGLLECSMSPKNMQMSKILPAQQHLQQNCFSCTLLQQPRRWGFLRQKFLRVW